jgi:hypothetical protein
VDLLWVLRKSKDQRRWFGYAYMICAVIGSGQHDNFPLGGGHVIGHEKGCIWIWISRPLIYARDFTQRITRNRLYSWAA